MPMMFGQDIAAVRALSQRAITALGGAVCDWLPWLDRSAPRSASSIISRSLVMNAMVQIYFGAPVGLVKDWIIRHALTTALSRREQQILSKVDSEITEQEKIDLFWYIEALWTLAWVGSLITDLPLSTSAGDNLASLLPDLQVDETPHRFSRAFCLRSPAEIYQQLDTYYLAHWYARDGELRKYDTTPFSIDIIMERRKALEWVSDETISDWDRTPDHT